uniref:CCHC-type domain-containing protein n=1 Tax=Brassica oleracea var. oleracea TaxID=109376 RepID=A0A0D3AQN9_BRAOL
MTRKTGGAGGDIQDQNPDGTTPEFIELKTLLLEMQSATQASTQVIQTSIQQLSDTVGTSTTATKHPHHQQQLPPFPPLQRQHQQNLPPNQRHHQHQQQIPCPQLVGHARAHDIDEDEDDEHRHVYYDDLQRNVVNNRWEQGFKVDIPEFHGGLKGDDLVDWLISVEEILEFKQVPATRRVSLVAMRFRGHATTWWKQLKTTQSRTGKTPIQSWEKLTKHLRQTFLPHNYERTMYTRLQNLRQGNRTVDEYAEEFALLLTRNEINDSQVQLVSRFIGGLRSQLQTAMAQFDPSTIGEAHRRAASFEQQSRTSNRNQSTSRTHTQDSAGSNTPSTATKETSDAAASSTKPVTPEEQQLRRSTRPNALRCYSCGELGHRKTACPHATRRGLLIDETIDEHEVYDSQDEDGLGDDDTTHPTTGDHGRLLVLRRACFTPQRPDDQWLRTNIFRSTCTIRDRICCFVIDSGSCRNVVSEEAITKLGITREKHPSPYNLGWLNDTATIRITERAIVPFSVGLHYKDRMYFDIASIDFCHLLLGRPWEFDRKIIHDGANNTYSFLWNAQNIILLLSKETAATPPTLTSPPAPPTLPSHLRTSDVFNIKHLSPFKGDNDPPDSWTNPSQPEGPDAA